MGGIARPRYFDFLIYTSSVADSMLVEDDLDSSEGDMSIEVISPPRRPVTRSVSAKRTADEMQPDDDDDALFISSSPRPRKVQRVTKSSEFTDYR